jgi:hypothetical protein
MPGNQAVHALAFGCIPIPSCRRRHKPAFIDVHGVFTTTHEPLAKAEELFSSERVAFGIAQSFFYGSPPIFAARSKYSAGRPGNAAPVPLESDRAVFPHADVTAPNPACGPGEGRDAGTPGRQA